MLSSSLRFIVGALTALLIYGHFWRKSVGGTMRIMPGRKIDISINIDAIKNMYSGPVFRYAPNYIVMNTVDGARGIYAGPKTNVQKAPFYKFLHMNNSTAVASVIDKTSHARKRHIVSQGFSDAALRSLEPYIIENIEQWCDLLGTNITDGRKVQDNEWSEAKNMSQWTNYLTFDVLGDICFGKPFGLLTSSAHRYLPQMLLSNMYAFQAVGNSPLLPFWKPIIEKLGFHKLIFPTISSNREKFQAFVLRTTGERMDKFKSEKSSGIGQRKDFFYWLVNATDADGNPGYTMPELWLEARTLLTAGSDTSSIVLAAAFFYICHNPRVLEKLQAELRSTFDESAEIRAGPKMNSCTYLRAVIDETLRMTPPVPSSIPREVQVGGITIGGHYFPKSTILGTSAYCLQHNDDSFLDPFTYRPERWIVDEGNGVTVEDLAAAKAAFIPFSLGSRGCVGKSLAYAEISMALARGFWMFDVRLKEGDNTGEGTYGDFMLADVFVGERDGPWVEFKPR
ncbi:hypothetical protein BP6252_05934 [Coleophoma cylindrospora]|uniref:Uncharacterized protein n=1 Tax=Coleophoma cylindrospora TaxID=1849047 RepID=A0A3D8RL28_9HELO|nr:hypothetical protein BP6252_05934 [Coleophoma cylindrospora]